MSMNAGMKPRGKAARTTEADVELQDALRKDRTRRRAQKRAALVLADIVHPLWTPDQDALLLDMKAHGASFLAVSDAMGRSRIAIEQRWHRLRAVPQIRQRLTDFGGSQKGWPDALMDVLGAGGAG